MQRLNNLYTHRTYIYYFLCNEKFLTFKLLILIYSRIKHPIQRSIQVREFQVRIIQGIWEDFKLWISFSGGNGMKQCRIETPYPIKTPPLTLNQRTLSSPNLKTLKFEELKKILMLMGLGWQRRRKKAVRNEDEQSNISYKFYLFIRFTVLPLCFLPVEAHLRLK